MIFRSAVACYRFLEEAAHSNKAKAIFRTPKKKASFRTPKKKASFRTPKKEGAR